SASRSLSATGWSAGGTLLAAFGVSLGCSFGVSWACSLVGSAAGVAAAAGKVPASAGAVTTSESLLAAAFSPEAVISAAAGLASALKSLMPGGGRLAGSGRGIAASIASSAALLRTGSPWANAELAETARKIAATAISTRSSPARFFEQSRIVTPLGRNCPGWEQLLVSSVAYAEAPVSLVLKQHSLNVCNQRLFFLCLIRLHARDSYADDLYGWPDGASAMLGALTQTDFKAPDLQ